MASSLAAVAAVVVDYESGDALAACVSSLLDDGATVVVVENGSADAAGEVLRAAGLSVPMVHPGMNLGYGAGANRGIAALDDEAQYVLVCNPDLQVHKGATAALAAALDAEPTWAIVGPRIEETDGKVYPSVRAFPSMLDAAGHALLALLQPDNRFSRRYRPVEAGGDARTAADWVSGACFLARRKALEELGGFDEAYFMFAEDMDLCWRAHQAGWGVGFEPSSVVTHDGGVSRRHHPYKMLVAHHRSAWRFAVRTTSGWQRAALPIGAAVLGVRFVMACLDQAIRRRG